MILLPVQNNKDYYFILFSEERLEPFLICPCCNSFLFGTWSRYPRKSLPNEQQITIQRMRCSNCLVTHALIPSFLLGKVRYTSETIFPYIEQFAEQDTSISKICKQPIENDKQTPPEISTVYRWFKKLTNKCKQLLPLLQQEIKKHSAKNKFKSQIKDTNADSNNYPIQHIYTMAEQLVKLSQQCDTGGNLLSPLIFLNYFCWQKTGQPLLC